VSDVWLLFAASGDLRDLIETVNRLHDTLVGRTIHVHLNDRSPMIVARNLLLLILLADAHAEEFVDTAIAVWYSIGYTSNQSVRIMTLIALALKNCSANCLRLGKLEVVLGANHVEVVKMLKEMARGCLRQDFNSISTEYKAVMLNKKRADYRDRSLLFFQNPQMRLAWCKQREAGLLLPFSVEYEPVNQLVPNVFLLDPKDGFVLSDAAEKMDGWDLDKVSKYGKDFGVPSNDIYGALFFYIRKQMLDFISQLGKHKVTIYLSCVDAEVFKSVVRFDRITVSNICDECYLGIAKVLHIFAPLLNSEANPESTLITLFMNWVHGGASKLIEHDRFKRQLVELRDKRRRDLKKREKRFFERMNEPPEWERATMATLCRIGVAGVQDCRLWPEFLDWLHKKTNAFPSAFLQKVSILPVSLIVPRQIGVCVGALSVDLPKIESSLKECFGLSGCEIYAEWSKQMFLADELE
jgi:hypothetical protein